MRSKRVMIIDDDPNIREVLSLNLTMRGYVVTAHESGLDALDILDQAKPDLIVLDVIMPDIDGWEVLKIIKDHYESVSLKVLMLTAKNSDRDKMIGKMILKADEYLTKPFDLNDLMSLIERLTGDINDSEGTEW